MVPDGSGTLMDRVRLGHAYGGMFFVDPDEMLSATFMAMRSSLKPCWARSVSSHATACGFIPSATAAFVGDFVDRGPENLRTCRIIVAMAEAGSAIAVMGNSFQPRGPTVLMPTHR